MVNSCGGNANGYAERLKALMLNCVQLTKYGLPVVS
jgi:hypothetical protein